MTAWPATRAKRVLDALLRVGWRIKRQSGSHRTLTREGWPDLVFGFHDVRRSARECSPGSPSGPASSRAICSAIGSRRAFTTETKPLGATTTMQFLDDRREPPLRDRTDRTRLEAMPDADIARAVAVDPNAAPLLTDELLARMRPVGPNDIAATRRRLGLSQTEFAAWFGISPGTLQNWEQGRRVPEGPGARAAAGDRARPGHRAAGDPVIVRRGLGKR